MARPRSLITELRLCLVRWLDPQPAKHEAWCIDCSLNGGKTLLLAATGYGLHVRQHRDTPGHAHLHVKVTLPSDRDD